MSKKFDAECYQHLTCSRPRRSYVYAAISSGVLLSISPVMLASTSNTTNVTNQRISTAINSRPVLANQKNLPVNKPLNNSLPQKTLKNNFMRTIRAAIAAKWHSSEVQHFIQAIADKPADTIIYNDSALSDNSFKPIIGHAIVYDSNVLRLSDNNTTLPAIAGRDKSDLIKQIRAGIAAKWNIQRQVLLLKAIVTQYWYATYNELDYLGRDIQAQWNWQMGKYLTGELGYTNTVTRGSFGQLNNLINNRQTQQSYFLNGEYQFLTGWFLRGNLQHVSSSFSSDVLKNNNLTENTGEIGIKYKTTKNNALGLRFAVTDGSFPNRLVSTTSFIDNAYVRKDLNLDWEWHYSVKTGVSGKVGYTQQNFDHLSNRDFSAPTARANLNWEVTPKTALGLSTWREIRFANSREANFVLTQGVELNPRWLPTPKLALTLPVSYENQEFLGDPGFVSNTSEAEKDKISKVGFNVDYAPLDSAKISLFWQLEHRASTNTSRNYQSNAVGLDMQMDF